VQFCLSIIGNVEARVGKCAVLICLAALVGAGCGNKLQTREAVERGIRKGVQQRGLNLDAMEVRIQNVNFHGDKADATVGFFPKGGQLSEGMTMHYTLEQRDNEWVIVGRNQSDMHQHSGGAQIPPPEMPSGHPQVPPK
jgi:hypothetical protein